MLTLHLVRHAKAEALAASDIERELADKGTSDAMKLGTLFTSQIAQPELVLYSQAIRTEQTFKLLCDNGLQPGDAALHDRLYHASADEVHQIITKQNVSSLMIVGHNPAMAILLNRFVKEADSPARLMHFPTATLATLYFHETDFANVTNDSVANLVYLQRGADIL